MIKYVKSAKILNFMQNRILYLYKLNLCVLTILFPRSILDVKAGRSLFTTSLTALVPVCFDHPVSQIYPGCVGCPLPHYLRLYLCVLTIMIMLPRSSQDVQAARSLFTNSVTVPVCFNHPVAKFQPGSVGCPLIIHYLTYCTCTCVFKPSCFPNPSGLITTLLTVPVCFNHPVSQIYPGCVGCPLIIH